MWIRNDFDCKLNKSVIVQTFYQIANRKSYIDLTYKLLWHTGLVVLVMRLNSLHVTNTLG